jgi:hypothetical protein
MKRYLKLVFSAGVTAAALALAYSSQAGGATVVVASPQIVVSSPAATITAAPDSYVWDGSEYVGVVGTQYYYLGPGNVWMVMDPPRLHRFQGWEKGHPTWRTHATHNVRYRNMDHAVRPQPMHSGPPSKPNDVPERHVNPGQYGPPQ